MLAIIICGTIVVIAFITLANYLLLPLPLLTYRHSGLEEDVGKVTSIEKRRAGVFAVGLTQGLEISPNLREGNPKMTEAWMTSYVHFRRLQLPKIGDTIQTSSIVRYHRFNGFNIGISRAKRFQSEEKFSRLMYEVTL